MTACPVCAAKVRQARAEKIDRALGRHLGAGGGAVFVTLTMPHDAGMPLEKVWNTISGAWAALVAGRHRKALRERFGVVGSMRAVEVTHGRAGWHPHLHVRLLVRGPRDLDDLQALHRFLRERWGGAWSQPGSASRRCAAACACSRSPRPTAWAATSPRPARTRGPAALTAWSWPGRT